MSQLLSRVPSNISISFLGQQLTPVTSVKDLDAILDCNLSFNDHISSLTSSLSSAVCQINRVRHLFSKDMLSNILNSLVFSKLFYCSTVWSGTSKENIQKLQLTQNFAARILTNKRKSDEISPVLNDLGWLSIDKLLCLYDVTMVYKCIHNLTPTYLSSQLVSRSTIDNHNTRNRDNISLPMGRLAAAQRNFTYRAECAFTLNKKFRDSRYFLKDSTARNHTNVRYIDILLFIISFQVFIIYILN